MSSSVVKQPLQSGTDSTDESSAQSESSRTGSVAAARRVLTGLRKLQLSFRDPLVRRQPSAAEIQASETRERVAERLKQVEAAAARLEHELREGGDGSPDPTDREPAPPPPPDEVTPFERPQKAVQISDVLFELDRTHTQLREATQAHESERAEWESTREGLEAQLKAAQSDGQTRGELQGALDDARAHLRRALDQHSAEMRARLDELNTAVDQHAALEAKLTTVQEEARQAAASHASDREDWGATHKALEASLERTSADHRQLIDAHAAEQATSAEARRALDTAVRDARADLAQAADAHEAELENREQALREAIAANAGLEDALREAERERQRLLDDQETARAAWTAMRQQLESEASQLGPLIKSRAELKEVLADSKRSLRQAIEQHGQERTEWEAKVRQLEAAVEDSANALTSATAAQAAGEAAWNAARQELESQIGQEQQGAAQAQAEAEARARDLQAHQAELEACRAELGDVRAELAQVAGAHEAELQRREHVLQGALAAKVGLDEALRETERERQQLLEDQEAGVAAWTVMRQQLESQVNQEQEAAARARAEAEARASELRHLSEACRAELAQVAEAQDAELEKREYALREAVAAKAGLEEAVREAEQERQRLVDDQEAARAAWNATRQQLESQVSLLGPLTKARAELKMALVDSKRTLHQALEQHAQEQADWAARSRELEAAIEERAAALNIAAAAQVASEAAWNAARHELESRISQEHQAAARAWAEADQRLRANAAQLAETTDSYAAERAAWKATREQLETELHQAHAERQKALEAQSVDRATWQATREELEAQLVETTAALQQLAQESDEFRRKVESEFHGDVRAELEARLFDARRLEEVGRLAGAMAPDLRDLVASIDRCGAELAHGLDGSDPRRQSAREIVALSERTAVLLRQLLAFSEKQSRPLAPVEVNSAVRRVEPLLLQMAGTDIDLHIELGPADTINASEEDVEHLVTVLVFSARDLLPVGGSLIVQTGRLDSGGARQDSLDGRAPGHHLLTVRASGYGVQPPQSSAALELIVQRCGGELFFDVTADQVAFFQVRFPLVRLTA
jgi:chromosome segregation ATPase